ncbi:hypothetical protein ACFS5L_20520 [Streptomyces phyllanthi]|uniref:Uncharacterized protein n=1 Tax=Streptomyces phyllanthi TaxID=1803180 RepID=A0A5N8WFR5_9ACTN|nr:hypothetical protein [Streptomyces phyllanthi]
MRAVAPCEVTFTDRQGARLRPETAIEGTTAGSAVGTTEGTEEGTTEGTAESQNVTHRVYGYS